MALKGIRVIEMAGLAPVPFCGMVLSDFGATVIRVDKVRAGFQPDSLARGKKSIAVDLKHPDGKSIIRKLASTADVFLDPFRPGVMEKLSLGPAELMKDNPKLVYGRISGYGQTGPLKHVAGHDINYASLSGVLSRFGRKNDRPTPPVNILGDFAGGGLSCAFGIVMALYERTSSGQGQVIDASMTEGAAYVSSFIFKTQHLPFWGKKRGENWLDSGAHFYNTYETKDGKYMTTGAIEPQFYRAFMEGLGLEGEPIAEDQFGDFEEYEKQVAERFLTKTQAEWTSIFETTDACVTPVLELDEAPSHPQHTYRQAFAKNAETDSWEPEPAPRLSRTPGKVPVGSRNPDVGEHTVEVLKDAGYPVEAIEGFLQSGIVEANGTSSKL